MIGNLRLIKLQNVLINKIVANNKELINNKDDLIIQKNKLI